MDEQQVEQLVKEHGLSQEAARGYLSKIDEVSRLEESTLRKIFGPVGLPIVELGAGAGEFTKELLDKYVKPGGKLYAVERLDTAAQKLRESITDSRLEVLTSDSSRLPLPDGTAGLVVSRAALHDFVSDDGDVAKALADCVRALAPGGVFLVYDKITDGFADVEHESAEGRMERMNVELAELEGKRCWGLHRSDDYRDLLERLGLDQVKQVRLNMPDFPPYVAMMRRAIDERREGYRKRWGPGVDDILDRLYVDFGKLPPRALPMVLMWGGKI